MRVRGKVISQDYAAESDIEEGSIVTVTLQKELRDTH